MHKHTCGSITIHMHTDLASYVCKNNDAVKVSVMLLAVNITFSYSWTFSQEKSIHKYPVYGVSKYMDESKVKINHVHS